MNFRDWQLAVRGFEWVAGFLAILLVLALPWFLMSVMAGINALLCMIIVLFLFVRIIPEKHAWVTSVFGEYWRNLYAGIYLIVPFAVNVERRWYLGDMLLTLFLDDVVDPRDGRRRGMVEVADDSVGVYFDVTIRIDQPVPADYAPQHDSNSPAYRATYNVDHLKLAVLSAIESNARTILGAHKVEEIIQHQETYETKLQEAVEKQFEDWGVQLIKLYIRDIRITPETEKARRRMIERGSEGRAEANYAIGHADAVRTTAEADRAALELRGRGERQRIQELMQDTGLDAEQIVGRELTLAQAEALKTATVLINTDSEKSINIPGATAAAKTTLDALQKKE